MSDSSSFAAELNTIVAFVDSAQESQYVRDFPFGTFQVEKLVPAEGEKPEYMGNEHGRWEPKACANLKNYETVKAFVEKNNLAPLLEDVKTKPGGMKFKNAVSAALQAGSYDKATDSKDSVEEDTAKKVADYKKYKDTHKEKQRMDEGISAYIVATMVWGVKLRSLVDAIRSGVKHDDLEKIKELYSRIGSLVVDRTLDGSRSPHYICKLFLLNKTTQDVGKEFLDAMRENRVVTMVNASAGSTSVLGEGGVFGDPFYSLGLFSQEENLYQSLPFHGQVFFQFFLGKYVETETEKGRVSRFCYRPEYAPSGGKGIALPVENNHYFFTACNNNKKHPMTLAEQKTLVKKAFTNMYLYAQSVADLDSNGEVAVLAGAWGLGVFEGDPQAFAEGIDEAAEEVNKSTGANEAVSAIKVKLPYYIPVDKPNPVHVKNYNVIAKKFICAEFSTA